MIAGFSYNARAFPFFFFFTLFFFLPLRLVFNVVWIVLWRAESHVTGRRIKTLFAAPPPLGSRGVHGDGTQLVARWRNPGARAGDTAGGCWLAKQNVENGASNTNMAAI